MLVIEQQSRRYLRSITSDFSDAGEVCTIISGAGNHTLRCPQRKDLPFSGSRCLVHREGGPVLIEHAAGIEPNSHHRWAEVLMKPLFSVVFGGRRQYSLSVRHRRGSLTNFWMHPLESSLPFLFWNPTSEEIRGRLLCNEGHDLFLVWRPS